MALGGKRVTPKVPTTLTISPPKPIFWKLNAIVYTCIYISLITMTNKSVMTFISVNKISVCLSVCLSAMAFKYKSGHMGEILRQYV